MSNGTGIPERIAEVERQIEALASIVYKLTTNVGMVSGLLPLQDRGLDSAAALRELERVTDELRNLLTELTARWPPR